MKQKNLLTYIQEAGININDDFIIEDKPLIDRKEELQYDQHMTFDFKEMKINANFLKTLSGSLSEKIKADCKYRAILFMCPEQTNRNIRSAHYDLEGHIKKVYEEMQEGGLFTSKERIQNNVQEIKNRYDRITKKVEKYRKEYYEDSVNFPDYEFQCSVHKIENGDYGVKRVDFIVGIEAYTYIANNITNIGKYQLGLQELL